MDEAVTDQTDEFVRRENTPFAYTAGWGAAGLRCWDRLLALPGSTNPPVPHFRRRCCG